MMQLVEVGLLEARSPWKRAENTPKGQMEDKQHKTPSCFL